MRKWGVKAFKRSIYLKLEENLFYFFPGCNFSKSNHPGTQPLKYYIFSLVLWTRRKTLPCTCCPRWLWSRNCRDRSLCCCSFLMAHWSWWLPGAVGLIRWGVIAASRLCGLRVWPFRASSLSFWGLLVGRQTWMEQSEVYTVTPTCRVRFALILSQERP